MKKDEKAHFGQTIRTESAPNRTTADGAMDMDEAVMGRKCRGGADDVSHSLSGAGTTAGYGDKQGKGGAKKGSY